MYKAGGVLGLLSLIMQLLLNRCSRLVWNLGVEAVAGVPQLLFRVTAVGWKWQFEPPRKCRDSPKSDGDKELNLNSVLPCPRISVTAQFWNSFFISSRIFCSCVCVAKRTWKIQWYWDSPIFYMSDSEAEIALQAFVVTLFSVLGVFSSWQWILWE